MQEFSVNRTQRVRFSGYINNFLWFSVNQYLSKINDELPDELHDKFYSVAYTLSNFCKGELKSISFKNEIFKFDSSMIITILNLECDVKYFRTELEKEIYSKFTDFSITEVFVKRNFDQNNLELSSTEITEENYDTQVLVETKLNQNPEIKSSSETIVTPTTRKVLVEILVGKWKDKALNSFGIYH
ncbi:20630_t:CDS:2 [Dentiscutata erythropus]|uniref:20630_t:CDS:1 n=1 Tax=Dentiscutata erythropus TaxID=1348616 RepID=A0A9N8VTK6_9GLOM|nr:20630_t:CDS:2 [Dentiscutata erythropus]